MFDDEVWDEDRWESFLKKDDERVTRYVKLLNLFLKDHPMPSADEARAMQQWNEAFRAFLHQHGWMRDEMELSSFFPDSEELESDEQDHFAIDGSDEDLIDSEDAFELLERLPVYQASFELTRFVLQWSDSVPGSEKDSSLVQFCANVMQITSNIAKGHGIGYEHDMLGGNIACLKRGIASANAALDLLREQKDRPYMDANTYRTLFERTYEVRNQVGVYIQDLRDRFNLGID